MQMQDITAGESWGCRFRVRTFVNEQGIPVDTRFIPPGSKVPGNPGDYEGVGSISKRDINNRLVEIVDHKIPNRTWTVKWDDCWDIDRVEYAEDK